LITQARAEKLAVISDLHLGNPFSRSRKAAIAFIQEQAARGFDICINGDGLEIAQTSFSRLAPEIPEIVKALRAVNRLGRTVY